MATWGRLERELVRKQGGKRKKRKWKGMGSGHNKGRTIFSCGGKKRERLRNNNPRSLRGTGGWVSITLREGEELCGGWVRAWCEWRDQ